MAASYLRVFKQHFPSLSRIIGSHPDTCLMTAAELYSKNLISKEVKDDVTERARAANVEVAMMLLHCLEVKIQESPELWETALEALYEMDGLKQLTKKMREETGISCHSPSTNRGVSSPQLHVAEIVDEVSRRDELLILIKNLRTHFDSFLLGVKHELQDVNIDDIKLILTSALSNFSLLFRGQLDEYIRDINQQESLHTLLQYLISKNFCGFLNYELLANIVNALGNKKSKHLLHTYMEYYETFAKQVKLRELIQPYLEKNQLVQANIIGLPTITFEVDGSWLNRTLYTFKSAIASAFVSAWRMIYADADPGSIIITYIVLPEDLSYVIRDLTSNGEFLSKLGIKALLRDGSGKVISSLVDDDDTRGASAQQCVVFCDAETQTIKVSTPSESIFETVQSLDEKIAIALQMNMTEVDRENLASIQEDIGFLKILSDDLAASSSTVSICSSIAESQESPLPLAIFPTPSPDPSPGSSPKRSSHHQGSTSFLTTPGGRKYTSSAASPLLRSYKKPVPEELSEDEDDDAVTVSFSVDSVDVKSPPAHTDGSLPEPKQKKKRIVKKHKTKKST